jgi:hypothetical protein
MKRIYLLFLLLIAVASSASAQTDVVLTKTCSDTMYYNNPPLHYYVISYTFKNKGPMSLDTSYRLRLHTPKQQPFIRLTFPATGFPKDSSVYWRDTVVFSANQPASANWCDTVYVTKNGNVVADVAPTDNITCKTIYFKKDPLASVGTLSGDENGMTVYPNPAINTVNLKYNFNSDNASVVIRDLLGKVVYQQELGKQLFGEKYYSFDVSHLNSGLYMVELSLGEHTKLVNKVSVQK